MPSQRPDANTYLDIPISGFMPCVVEPSGAKDAKVRWDRPRPDGTLSGHDTVSLRFEVQ